MQYADKHPGWFSFSLLQRLFYMSSWFETHVSEFLYQWYLENAACSSPYISKVTLLFINIQQFTLYLAYMHQPHWIKSMHILMFEVVEVIMLWWKDSMSHKPV